mgnify:CR=1 FL=1
MPGAAKAMATVARTGGRERNASVEMAQRALDADQMAKAQEEMLQGKFTLESFRDTMKNVQKIGSMKDILKMLGMGGMLEQMPNQVDPEGEMKKIEGMINSMTPDERKFPERIDINRRRRIAKGSGTEPADVNRLLKDFENMAAQMQKVSGLGMRDRMRAVREMSQAAMMNPHASMMREKQRSKAKEMDADKKKKLRKEAKAQRKKNKRR